MPLFFARKNALYRHRQFSPHSVAMAYDDKTDETYKYVYSNF